MISIWICQISEVIATLWKFCQVGRGRSGNTEILTHMKLLNKDALSHQPGWLGTCVDVKEVVEKDVGSDRSKYTVGFIWIWHLHWSMLHPTQQVSRFGPSFPRLLAICILSLKKCSPRSCPHLKVGYIRLFDSWGTRLSSTPAKFLLHV